MAVELEERLPSSVGHVPETESQNPVIAVV